MHKKAFLMTAGFAAILIGIFLVYKVLTVSVKSSASPAASIPVKIEKASREENELFELASRYEQSGDLLNARDTYRKLIEKFSSSGNVQKAQEELENMNVRILLSPIPTPDSISYEIREGDTLAKIAKKYSNTQDMILKANNLKDPKVVPLGRKIKVHNEKFSIVVDKSQNILMLKSGNKIVKTYRVSTGINNSTPVGSFKIINKIVDPPWYTAGSVIPSDSPKNILGSRWMGISAPSYGIHGTTEPLSIGGQVTSGCIRMKNAEVEELYSLVPQGSEVVIVD